MKKKAWDPLFITGCVCVCVRGCGCIAEPAVTQTVQQIDTAPDAVIETVELIGTSTADVQTVERNDVAAAVSPANDLNTPGHGRYSFLLSSVLVEQIVFFRLYCCQKGIGATV